MMMVYIAFLLIYGLQLHWIFYFLTAALWLVQFRFRRGPFLKLLDSMFPE